MPTSLKAAYAAAVTVAALRSRSVASAACGTLYLNVNGTDYVDQEVCLPPAALLRS